MPRYPEYQIHDLDTYGYGRIIQTIDGKFYDGWGNTVIFTLFGKEVSINVEGVGEDSTDGGNVNITNNTNNTNNTDLFKDLQDQITNLTKTINDQKTTIENQNTVPTGTIIMWGGSEAGIPPGWNLCDGSTLYAESAKLRDQLIKQGNPFGSESGSPRLPDLRERFVVGAGKGKNSGENNSSVVGNAYVVGDSGGESSIKLMGKQIPQHDHYFDVYNTNSSISYALKYTGSIGAGISHQGQGVGQYAQVGNNLAGDSIGTDKPNPKLKTSVAEGYTSDVKIDPITLNGKSQYNGETKASVPVENRPPYFALCYIIKL